MPFIPILGAVAALAGAGAGIYSAVKSNEAAGKQEREQKKLQEDVQAKQKQTEMKQAQAAAAARQQAIASSYGGGNPLDTGASKLGGTGSAAPKASGTLLGL